MPVRRRFAFALAAFLAAVEIEKWKEVAKAANVKLD